MKIQNIVYKFLLLYSFLPLFTLFNPVMGQNSTQLTLADSLYAQQKFTQAYKVYEEVLETGVASPAMLLRMAYIQESLNNTTETLYLLNRYYQLTAKRDALQKMEALAEEYQLQGYEYSDIDYIRNQLYQNRQYIVMGLMLLAGALFLLMLYNKFRLGKRPFGIGVAVFVLLAGLAYFVNIPLSREQAIVVKNYVPLMSGPSAGASVEQMINKGHRLQVLNKQDVWYKVQWGEQILFIKESSVTKI
jgi:hypothetical protein